MNETSEISDGKKRLVNLIVHRKEVVCSHEEIDEKLNIFM